VLAEDTLVMVAATVVLQAQGSLTWVHMVVLQMASLAVVAVVPVGILLPVAMAADLVIVIQHPQMEQQGPTAQVAVVVVVAEPEIINMTMVDLLAAIVVKVVALVFTALAQMEQVAPVVLGQRTLRLAQAQEP